MIVETARSVSANEKSTLGAVRRNVIIKTWELALGLGMLCLNLTYVGPPMARSGSSPKGDL